MNINKITGDGNINANRDINYFLDSATNQEAELGVINDIFIYVIENSKSQENIISNENPDFQNKLLHLNEKIKLNFQTENEIKEVQEYFTKLFSKISSVEKGFQLLDEDAQMDVHFYISSLYQDLKRAEENKVVILRQLTDAFIPPNHLKNPTYVSIAQAIVLFFFDDCTIFEKTKKESNNQTNLFEDI